MLCAVVEPYINQLPPSLNNFDIELTSLEIAINEANLILILVNHKQFYSIPQKMLDGKVIIDTRGVLN